MLTCQANKVESLRPGNWHFVVDVFEVFSQQDIVEGWGEPFCKARDLLTQCISFGPIMGSRNLDGISMFNHKHQRCLRDDLSHLLCNYDGFQL